MKYNLTDVEKLNLMNFGILPKREKIAMTKLYAIYDRMAGMTIGKQIYMMNHDAEAVRLFGDIASAKGSIVEMHLEDFELLCLGEINIETGEITTNVQTILTGTTWRVAQEKKTGGNAAATAG